MKRGTVLAGVFFAIVFFAMIAAPLTAQAQGVPGGAAHGFHEGNRIAGPVGAVVGTAVGGVIGGVEGVLGINQRPAAYSVRRGSSAAGLSQAQGVARKTKHRAPRYRSAPRPGYVN